MGALFKNKVLTKEVGLTGYLIPNSFAPLLKYNFLCALLLTFISVPQLSEVWIVQFVLYFRHATFFPEFIPGTNSSVTQSCEFVVGISQEPQT